MLNILRNFFCVCWSRSFFRTWRLYPCYNLSSRICICISTIFNYMRCRYSPIQNSQFIIPFAARTLTHPITPIAPIIARVAHTPLFPLLPQSLPTNSTTAAFSPFWKGGRGECYFISLPVPQFKIQNSKFIICQFPRWRKLAACAQFKIQNSEFTILFTSPTHHYCALPPSLLERGNGGEDSSGASLQLVPNSQFKIHNPKFKIAAKVIFFGYIVKILYLCI